VNRLRKKASAYVDKVTLNKHAMPVKTRGANGPAFGDLRVVDVTPRDIVEVMAAQPKEHRAQTRLHIYQRLRRLFDLAIFPLELRKEGDNPVSKRVRPQADAAKEFGYLYPAELLALVDGRNAAGEIVVPLVRRVLYATAVYTGFRGGSLLALTWENFDFDNRALTALSTKDKTPAFAEGEPPLPCSTCSMPGASTSVAWHPPRWSSRARRRKRVASSRAPSPLPSARGRAPRRRFSKISAPSA
jgi:integrase